MKMPPPPLHPPPPRGGGREKGRGRHFHIKSKGAKGNKVLEPAYRQGRNFRHSCLTTLQRPLFLLNLIKLNLIILTETLFSYTHLHQKNSYQKTDYATSKI